MTEKPVPCLHCALVETLIAYIRENGLQGSIRPTANEGIRQHAQMSADIFRVLEQHIEEGLDDVEMKRSAWRGILRAAIQQTLQHVTLKDIVDGLAKAADDATVKH